MPMNPEQHKAASAAITSLLADATRFLDRATSEKEGGADTVYIANMAAASVISAMANAMIAMRDAK